METGCPQLVLDNDEHFAVAVWNAAIERALLVLPGGSLCDPQEAADTIRELIEPNADVELPRMEANTQTTSDQPLRDAACSPYFFDTPETDAHWREIEGSGYWQNNRTRLAMEKLEHERNQYRVKSFEARKFIATIEERLREIEYEAHDPIGDDITKLRAIIHRWIHLLENA